MHGSGPAVGKLLPDAQAGLEPGQGRGEEAARARKLSLLAGRRREVPRDFERGLDNSELLVPSTPSPRHPLTPPADEGVSPDHAGSFFKKKNLFVEKSHEPGVHDTLVLIFWTRLSTQVCLAPRDHLIRSQTCGKDTMAPKRLETLQIPKSKSIKMKFLEPCTTPGRRSMLTLTMLPRAAHDRRSAEIDL